MCPREFGRASTLPPIAPARKARVVGLACTRICPRLSSLSRRPRKEQNSLRNQKLFWSPLRRKFAQESLTTCPASIGDSSAILRSESVPFGGRMRIPFATCPQTGDEIEASQ